METNNEKQITKNDARTEHVPFFSIIVPVYNVAPYLRECLDSVLAQTFANWECLCVNDGSTDDSGAILDEYAEKDSRFRVFHKKNGGVSSARNLALDNAEGEWVGFLDGDDVWMPNLLMEINRVIELNVTTDVVRFKTKDFISNSQCFFEENIAENNQYRIEDIRAKLTSDEMTCTFAGKVYRRDIVHNVRFQCCIVGEDLLFLAQCMLKANMQIALDRVGYGYRQRLDSVTHQRTSSRVQYSRLGYVPAMLKLFNDSSKQIDVQCWKQYLTKITDSFVRTQFLLPREVRHPIWSKWRACLCELSQLEKVSLCWRIRLKVLSVDSYLILLFFSVLPYTARSFLYRRIRLPLQQILENFLR